MPATQEINIPEFEDIFKQIIINLKLCGISDNSTLGLKFYIQFLVIIIIVLQQIAFFASTLSSEDTNFLELTASAPCIGLGSLATVKLGCMGFKKRKIFELIKQLGKLHQEILEDPKQNQLRDIILVKSLTKIYLVFNAILFSVYWLVTLVMMFYSYLIKGTVNLILPYNVSVPFSTDVWYKWLVVYLQTIICGYASVLYYATADALYFNLTSLVCSNFSVLCNEIEQLTPNNVLTLSSIVKRHQYILELSNVLEEIFSLQNLVNVLVASIEICVLCFNILVMCLKTRAGKRDRGICQQTGDWSKLPGFILFLMSQIQLILVMSVFGEMIIRESGKVGEAAFLCKWYNMEEKHKKIILTLLTRAHNYATDSFQFFCDFPRKFH